MSKHAFLPSKTSILSLYEALNVAVPTIPKEGQYGWKIGRVAGTTRLFFQPTEADMNRRLIYLLDNLSNELKARCNGKSN